MSSSVRPRKQYTAEISYPAAVALIDWILNTALNATKTELHKWIDEKVPKRTGQLRDSLHRNLESSRVIKSTLLKLFLGTHIDYAEFVNDMTTSQVAHDGEVGYAYYYGHYGKITLDDPDAIGSFFDAMIVFARQTLQTSIYQTIRMGVLLGKVARGQSQQLINYVVVRRT